MSVASLYQQDVDRLYPIIQYGDQKMANFINKVKIASTGNRRYRQDMLCNHYHDGTSAVGFVRFIMRL